MTNPNSAIGLRPIMASGMAYNGLTTLCAVPASQTGNIFLGDPVIALGGTDGFGVPLVGIATAGATNQVLGSMVSVSNGPASGGGKAAATITRDLPVYRQASLLNYIMVSTDPNQLYEIQEDSVGGAIAAATGGFANGNLVAGAGSTVTGYSGWQLQSSGVSSSANPTFQLRLIGLVRGPDNAIGVNANWLVRLNLPQLWNLSGV